MHLDPEQLAASYAKLGEQELLELGRSYDSLTDSAQAAFTADETNATFVQPSVG
jgi:hypothetical protein